MRLYLAQAANVWIFMALAGAMITAGTFSPFALELTELQYDAIRIGVWAGIAALALLALVPRRRVSLATNLLVALGSIFLAIQVARINLPPRNGVVADFPATGEWYVYHGGRSMLLSTSHYAISTQRDAIDLVKLATHNRTYVGDKRRLTSYAAFGDPVIAPADGRVTTAVDGLPDMAIGDSDEEHAGGNLVVLELGDGRYMMIGHLESGSVRVEHGDRVRRGQTIARVGNSGSTTEPHLHIQIQNEPTFKVSRSSLRTYPMLFRGLVVTRRGEESRPDEVEVRRGDRIRRIG